MDRVGRKSNRAPRSFMPKALAAAAALALAVGMGLLGGHLLGAGEQRVTVHLSLEAPEARSVSVVGDWNQWDPGVHRLEDHNQDGIWEIEITIDRDRLYQYQFIVDDSRWTPDPKAPVQVDDGFGGENSVLDV